VVEKEEQQALMLVPWPLPSLQLVVEEVDHCLKQVLIPLALLRY
jgi:hypothetical protein